MTGKQVQQLAHSSSEILYSLAAGGELAAGLACVNVVPLTTGGVAATGAGPGKAYSPVGRPACSRRVHAAERVNETKTERGRFSPAKLTRLGYDRVRGRDSERQKIAASKISPGKFTRRHAAAATYAWQTRERI